LCNKKNFPDIIDQATPFIMAANLLRKIGAARIILVATHGVFAENAAELLQSSVFEQVLVLDTISQV
jgi:ribose-phosphate pyrophosphokinase